MPWDHKQRKGILAREQRLGYLGRLPEGGGIEAGIKEKKSISGKGDSTSKGPEVGQVEEQTVI